MTFHAREDFSTTEKQVILCTNVRCPRAVAKRDAEVRRRLRTLTATA